MNKEISFFQKLKKNNYVKIFIFSFFTLVLSYGLVVLFAYILYSFNEELLLYILLTFSFILIYHLFNKKYIKAKSSLKNLIIPLIFFILILMELTASFNNSRGVTFEKPVIYLYPETQQEVNVKLKVDGEIIADYPKYDKTIKGWNITAYPDGKIIQNSKEYSYLFWEAEFNGNDWDLSKGFIVEGKNSREFLEEKLSYMGLTPKEYNEFIIYWYPKMMNNKYNLVYFAGEDYTSKAPLEITPKPDSLLRVFMVIKPLKEKVEISKQNLEKFDRKGFSAIEWGGTILY